jgi:hypothetical protein
MHHATLGSLLLAFTVGCGSSADSGPDAAGTHAPDAERPDAGANVKAFPLTSVDQGIAYTAKVTVGGTQTFNLDVDTGSTSIGVAQTTCSSCGVTPEWTPGASAVDKHLTTQSQFGDGSSWSAEVFTDMIDFMGDNGPVAVRFGSITSQNGFFRGDNSDQGIIGFGTTALAAPNTDSFIDKRKAMGLSTDFSFQFCTDNGQLWFDGFDPGATTGDMQYTPLVTSAQNPFFSLNLTSATIGGTSIGLTGASIADTGTSIMVIPTAVETKMLNAIKASPGFTSTFPGGTLDEQNCLDGTGKTAAQIDAALPPMVVTIPGMSGTPITLSMPATKSYLFFQQGGWCFGAAAMDGLPTILGDTFLRAFVTEFDLPNNRIGFAPVAGCTSPAAHFEGTPKLTPPHWMIRGHRM